MVLRRPRNFNPIKVKIRAIDIAETKFDPDFKVPINRKVRKTEFVYNAQINLGRKEQDSKVRELTGDRTETNGHLVMRTFDLAPNTKLPKPQKGWKIVAIYVDTDQEQKVDYLIEEVRHESPLRGRPLLIYLPFIENVEKARSAT